MPLTSRLDASRSSSFSVVSRLWTASIWAFLRCSATSAMCFLWALAAACIARARSARKSGAAPHRHRRRRRQPDPTRWGACRRVSRREPDPVCRSCRKASWPHPGACSVGPSSPGGVRMVLRRFSTGKGPGCSDTYPKRARRALWRACDGGQATRVTDIGAACDPPSCARLSRCRWGSTRRGRYGLRRRSGDLRLESGPATALSVSWLGHA